MRRWLSSLVLVYLGLGTSYAAPAIQNTVSDYVFGHKSGSVSLKHIIQESSWEFACVVEKGSDPLFISELHLKRKISTVVTPVLDEGLLQFLWKIAIIKDGMAAIYYFDERDIEFENLNSCMPLRDAILVFAGRKKIIARLTR